MLILKFLIVTINLHLAVSDDRFAIRRQCHDYRPEKHVNIDEIKGRWFVVEVIFHNETDYNQFNLMSHFNQITILKPDRQGQRHEHDDLRITLYDNNNLSNHIKGRISDISSGNMMAFITNKDERLEDYDIKYNAVIQILRKTDRYMVWHFCTNPLFSVYMVRNYDVPPSPEISKQVQDLLREKRLEVLNIQPVRRPTSFGGGSSASMITFVLYFHIILLFLCRLFQ